MRLKSYQVFTKSGYRWFMLLVVPVIVLFIALGLQSGLYGLVPGMMFSAEVSVSAVCSILSIVEIICDYFSLSGIYSKHVDHMNFLKVSRRGNQFFMNAYVVDMIRRCLEIVFCVGAVIGTYVIRGHFLSRDELTTCICYTVVTLLIIIWAVFIIRFWTLMWCNVITAYLVGFIHGFIVFILKRSNMVNGITNMIFLLLIVGSMIFMYMFTKKKVEAGYYDK